MLDVFESISVCFLSVSNSCGWVTYVVQIYIWNSFLSGEHLNCFILFHDQIFEVCRWDYFCNFITGNSCKINSWTENLGNIVHVFVKISQDHHSIVLAFSIWCFAFCYCSSCVFHIFSLCVVFVALGPGYCLWEVSLVRYGMVLIAVMMRSLLSNNLPHFVLSLCCLLLLIKSCVLECLWHMRFEILCIALVDVEYFIPCTCFWSWLLCSLLIW